MAKPNKQPETAKELVKPYEPTPYERRTLDTMRARNAEKPLAPRMKVTNKDDSVALEPDYADPSIAHDLLLEALGTRDPDFLNGLLKQLCNAAVLGNLEADEEAVHGSRGAGLDRLPVSWGSWRRTERQTQRNVSARTVYQ